MFEAESTIVCITSTVLSILLGLWVWTSCVVFFEGFSFLTFYASADKGSVFYTRVS